MAENMKRLTEIFQDIFDDENLALTSEMKVKEIKGWDSFVHISLMAAIQDEFGITYSIEEIMEMETIDKILLSIEKKQ